MSDELKPCPFCGSLKVYPHIHNTYCSSCKMSYFGESWNKRPIEDALRAELAQWESGEIFSKRAADIYEELRANTATPVPEDNDGAIEYRGNIYIPSTLYDAGIEACLVEIKRLRDQEA